MALSQDTCPVDARVEVTVTKTPNLRIDLNDFSIPHTHVRSTVTVLARAQCVRVFDGATILVNHVRCYDFGVQVELTALVDANYLGACCLTRKCYLIAGCRFLLISPPLHRPRNLKGVNFQPWSCRVSSNLGNHSG